MEIYFLIHALQVVPIYEDFLLLNNSLTPPNEMENREWPTVALTSYCREFGALVFRVHNSLDNFNAMRMTEAIISAE